MMLDGGCEQTAEEDRAAGIDLQQRIAALSQID
jgi:hypothetical protein